MDTLSTYSRVLHKGLPSNELFSNVPDWCDCGILPSKLLLDKSRVSRNVIFASSCDDRSSDSSWLILPNWEGIFPVNATCDIFNICSDTRLLTKSGMVPLSLLFEKSTEVKAISIL